MSFIEETLVDIFNSASGDFEALALEIFLYQSKNCKVYKEFINRLGIDTNKIYAIEKIPFLPIEFFKSKAVKTETFDSSIVFTSSGTTGATQSKHFVKDLSVYEKSFSKAFELFYGSIEEYCILGLLPSYLEREGSSLIYMVDNLVRSSKHPKSGFFLKDFDSLTQTLEELESKKQKTILFGVSFALLDFVEQYQFELKHTTVMDTGGMKGRRKEVTQFELHEQLCQGFGVDQIHSEYGMTELLSQAYSSGNGKFICPPWMKILIRDTSDPLSIKANGKSGGINIIDLANINSCCFIATQDLGKKLSEDIFEVQGRFDHSDVRGCNLMVI